jgi:MFS family permease
MNKKSTVKMAWMMWGLASLFVFYKYIIELSPGVLKNDIQDFFGVSLTETGFLISIYYYAYGIMQLPIGLLLDRFGPRRVMLVSLLLCLIGTFILGVLPSSAFALACLARFITGLGAATAIIGCMKLIAIWFEPREFAKMAGLMMTVGMVGAGLSDNIIESVINHYHFPWQDLLKWVCYIGLVLWLLYFLFIKEHPDRLAGGKSASVEHVPFKESLASVLKNPQSWLLSIYSGLMFSPVTAFAASWGQSFIRASDPSIKSPTEVITFILFGFALGSPLWGWLSDKVYKRKIFLVMCTFCCLILSLFIVYIPGLSSLTLSALFFLFGFIVSAFVLSFSMIREINHLNCAATSVGFMNTFNAFLSALIAFGVGVILNHFWIGRVDSCHQTIVSLHTYHLGMALIPFSIMSSSIFLFYIKETNCKQQ